MLSHLKMLWTRWLTFIRVRNELLTYDDRELFDLGIRPGEINRLAWEEALHPHNG